MIQSSKKNLKLIHHQDTKRTKIKPQRKESNIMNNILQNYIIE
jgi:hypothetical protein